MSLEEFSPDIDTGAEGGAGGAEVASEAMQESLKKARAQSKKAQARVQKTQKDEKKAKKHDFFLAGFLVKILINKTYDPLLEPIFKATHAGCPSNIILGVLSLVHLELSDAIRDIAGKEHIVFDYVNEEPREFDDNNIRPPVRARINAWVEDMVDASCIEFSSLSTLQFLESKENIDIIESLMESVFAFFLNNLDITIQAEKCENICEFLMGEVMKEMKKLEIEKI
ncbi:hypothetical protein MK079_01835 [Candidatus Gracilibacteria bacterium]|nr:hypothetical protein [Candidatus Gracilibacteria bacterium]